MKYLIERLYLDEQMSIDSISTKLSLSRRVVYTVLCDKNIMRSQSEAAYIRATRNAVSIDENLLKKLYLEEEMSVRTIADKTGASPKNIYNKLCELGIIRSHSESANIYLSKLLPDQIKERMKNSLWSGEKRMPNGDEEVIDVLIQQNFPNKWEYVGDLKFWVENKNPDWKHRQYKLLIEYNGCKWHCCSICNKKHPHGFSVDDVRAHDAEKLKIFEKNGYKTLVVWEHEEDNAIINKIRNFMEVYGAIPNNG